MKSSFLPTNGLSFGAYPQRDINAIAPWTMPAWLRFSRRPGYGGGMPEAMGQAVSRYRARYARLSDDAVENLLVQAGACLRQQGLAGKSAPKALAIVADVLRRRLDVQAYDTQLFAARRMLHGDLVEMQTGEGKTLAAALAAGVAGIAGCSVYVLTANDYLVQRDHDDLLPFFQGLGLTTGTVTAADDVPARVAAWRQDVVYSSARELAFDYLRDHVACDGERDALIGRAEAIGQDRVGVAAASSAPNNLLVPGLGFAIVDEADSLLLDEAVMPLILATPAGDLDVPGLHRAYAVARQLSPEQDYLEAIGQRRVSLTEVGYRAVTNMLGAESGVLKPLRRAVELVETALAAMRLYRCGIDYAVVENQIVLIDELTGRMAHGRQWQGALQQMVEIKEGLEPTPPSKVSAQISFQRLFPRFLHLCGMSGTLSDASSELASLYGLPVTRVPLAKADRRINHGESIHASARQKWSAVLESIRDHQRQGRPVLIGNDSVADSTHLSRLLAEAGIEHQVLNATQCEQEAASLVRAGRAGVVTVTTNMAGRGTDIRLTEVARRNGGLHVLATMRNRSRRIDRQLAGRAARHGDPGSHEVVLSLDDRLIGRVWPASFLRLCKFFRELTGPRPLVLYRLLFSTAQRIEERRDLTIRRVLREHDRLRQSQWGFAGRHE